MVVKLFGCGVCVGWWCSWCGVEFVYELQENCQVYGLVYDVYVCEQCEQLCECQMVCDVEVDYVWCDDLGKEQFECYCVCWVFENLEVIGYEVCQQIVENEQWYVVE